MVHSYSYGWAKGEKRMSRCELVANMRLVHSDWLPLSASGWHATQCRDSHGELVSFVTSLSCLSKISYRTPQPQASIPNPMEIICPVCCIVSIVLVEECPSLCIVEQKRKRVARGIWVPTQCRPACTYTSYPEVSSFHSHRHVRRSICVLT